MEVLNFSANGIALHEGRPSVVLLVGKDEQQIEFTPTEEGTKTQTVRLTPLGEVSEETYVWYDPRGYAFTWTVGRFSHRNGILLRGRFYNGSNEPVRLKEIVLCQTPLNAVTVDGAPDDWLLSPLTYSMRIATLGTLLPSVNEDTRTFCEGVNWPLPENMPADEKNTDGHWRTYTDYMTLYTEKSKTGWTLGAVGRPIADVRFDCRVDGNKLTLVIASDMSNIVVEAGQSKDAQDTVILAEKYAYAVKSILQWTAMTHGHRTHRGPVFGWCSWYDLHNKVNAQSVNDLVDAVGRLKNQIPFQVIQIDDGYQRQGGDWRCNDKFPEGWGPLVKNIQDAGAAPGIWLAPQAVHDSLDILKEHPDWFQRDAKGKLLGGSVCWGSKTYWLDPSHPEAQKFIRQVIRDAKKEGFSYFKIDFNTFHSDCRYYDSSKTRLGIIRNLYYLYREEIGEDGYLLACSQFIRGVFGYADAARIGYDSEPVWRAKHPCTFLECIRAVGMTSIANGIFFDHDPDVTYSRLRGSVTLPELQTWHGFVGLLGGMAMISEPLQSPEYSTPEALRMVEILNPPGPERGRSHHAATDRNHTQFGFESSRPWGNSASILLWNPSEEPASQTLDAEPLGGLSERFHIWSFWDEKYLGVGKNGFCTEELSPHGSALLRLTAIPVNEEIPVLIGSSLHISMGSAEVADVAATRERMIIRLTDAGARSGGLFVYSKRLLSLDSAIGCRVESMTSGSTNVWKVSVGERERSRKQILSLLIK